MEQLIFRLSILKDSQTISEEVFNKVNSLMVRLEQKGIVMDSEVVTMMVTHIAMALQRVNGGEAIGAMDEDIKEEINNFENIQQAHNLWDENIDIFEKLSINEKYYILANFCNIL